MSLDTRREIDMRASEATAAVFVKAFESLSGPEKQAVLRRLFSKEDLREDFIDTAQWLVRRREPTIPYGKVRSGAAATPLQGRPGGAQRQ